MAVPNNNSWKIWDDAGKPIGNVNLLVDTYNAKYCDGTTLRNVDIELRIKNVSFRAEVINGIPVNFYEQILEAVPASAPIGASATLNLRTADRRADIPPDSTFPETEWVEYGYTIEQLTIPAGSTAGVSSSTYLLEQQPDALDPEGLENFIQQTFWAIQQNDRNCAPPPPTCTLEITGVTVTNETISGANDGTITIEISGSTGTTTYYLNDANPQSSNVFTGLGEGTYSVTAEEGDCFDEVTDIQIAAGEFRSRDFTVSEPNDFVASENPIVTNLRTAYNGQPAFASTSFTFDSGVVDGSTIVFTLENPQAYSATFTAKDFPNRENFFVTTTLKNRAGLTVGSNSTDEIATTFAEAVRKDVTISRYYFIDVDGSVVTLTSKEATARLTLTDGINVTAGAGITINQITAGADEWEGSIISDYSLYTEVYVGAENTQYGVDLSTVDYDNYTTLELPFSQNNQHRFDASDVMKNFVSTPKIDLTFTGFTYITSMIRPFFVKYGENYPLITNENTKKQRSKGDTGYKWVLNSSLDFEEANDVGQYFTGGSFLTNAPNPLLVQRNQTNFLYFILPKDLGQDLTLQGDIDYYNGTSQSGITFINISSGATNLGGVYALNTSYEALGLAAYEELGNTKIKRVTFGVYADDVLVSEERIYRFEIDEQSRKFGVSFLNKLGAYDTFDFVGIVENSILRTNKTYTVPRSINNDGSSPVGFKSEAMFDTEVTKTITVNSGWIDEDHFNWLIELMESNNIYSYTEDNQNYLNVTGYTYTKSSLDDLFELEITFKLTLFENNITV